jgi:hypothetical protein
MDVLSPFAAHVTHEQIQPAVDRPLIPAEGIAADQLASDRARSVALIEGLRRLAIAEAFGKLAAARIRAEKAAIVRLNDLLGSH